MWTRLGVGLLGLSIALWLPLPVLPFVDGLSGTQKAAVGGGLVVLSGAVTSTNNTFVGNVGPVANRHVQLSVSGQIREFHDEGIIFAENFIPPAALAAYLPAHGRRAWELMRRYNNMIVSGVLIEDSTVRITSVGLDLSRRCNGTGTQRGDIVKSCGRVLSRITRRPWCHP